jgi:hypothetical protein
MKIAGDILQLEKFGQAILHEYDLCGIGCNARGAAQRNRDIGFFQRNRVIDAVANEADLSFP